MKTSYYKLLALVMCMMFAPGAYSQEDVLLTAMNDELMRNLTELKLPGYDKPFFIMYGMQDQKTWSVAANLGAITESSMIPSRFKTASRVLVGSYDFNDESLEENSFSQPTAREIQLPIDDDYNGIRRAFWSTTDKVYRDAAKHFQKHQETVKESGKELSQVPHRTFAKSAPVKIIENLKPYAFNKSEWEAKARNLSAIFLKYSFIENSVLLIQYDEGHKYLVSTEGTMIKIPFRRTTYTVVCQSRTKEGEFGMDGIVHVVESPDQLPDEKQLQTEIEAMIANVREMPSRPKLQEEYNGPVLVLGPAVAEIFSSVLYRGKESLMASNNVRKLTGYQYDDDLTSMDNKIGKPVLNESISIKAKPKLTSFKGTTLMGSFQVDEEGIVPADELVLVEKGILKNLMNDRTLTQASSQQANGFGSGPGVLEILLNYQDTEKALKDKLIAKAKSEGLDYAFIVRASAVVGKSDHDIYRVDVNDGKETQVQNATLETDGFKTFKRILGSSSNYQAYNLGGSNLGGPLGQMTSYIVPDALLLEEMEIKPFPMPTLKEEYYVSNPMGWE